MSTFQQRHYEAVALALRTTNPGAGVLVNRSALAQHERVTNQLCAMFALDNPRFDEHKFLMASEPSHLTSEPHA